ncbi:uncharacterized protein TNCV_3007961 [Trichonephila clavipes]|nr:uncharacterized protein TNCV_3007961 [Trichonephila clavipes]
MGNRYDLALVLKCERGSQTTLSRLASNYIKCLSFSRNKKIFSIGAKCQDHQAPFEFIAVGRLSTATGILMSASSIHRRLLHRGLRARVPLYRNPLMANHRRLRLHWAHEHRAWQADWHQVVFSDESCFNMWDHDNRIRVRRYAG